MAFDANEQRRVMSHFPTGVMVITSQVGDAFAAMTANAVLSLSLDPPLFLFAVGKQGSAYGLFSRCDAFAVNILRAEQVELSNRFAKSGPKSLEGLNIKTAVTGSPILADALGYLDCRKVNTLPGGDHDIILGEIVAGDAFEGEPLVYCRGRYTKPAS